MAESDVRRDQKKVYYDRRARQYDETSYLHAGAEGRETVELERVIAGLSPARVLDVACGTGFLTRFLRGGVTCVDSSDAMLQIARSRLPGSRFVRAEVPPLPFAGTSFDRVFTSNFYGHLLEEERVRFLEEAGRVATELVVVDVAVQPDYPIDFWEERQLRDGSRL
jgi:demethylmenaquinone methyltransferase/2-methoxy-6-polyprenyl-1,4-benzoquinol methylase